MPQERIPEAGEAFQRALFGPMDRHLRAVRERYGVRISARNEALLLEGPDDDAVQEVARRVKRLMVRMDKGGEPASEEVENLLFGTGADARPRARAPREPIGRTPRRGNGAPGPGRRLPNRPPTTAPLRSKPL